MGDPAISAVDSAPAAYYYVLFWHKVMTPNYFAHTYIWARIKLEGLKNFEEWNIFMVFII